MATKPKTIIIMKVGPHSGMSLADIIKSKKQEEEIHGCHYWGYSGVFCQPKATQQFCEWSKSVYDEYPTIVLVETKSSYKSNIGLIRQFSENGVDFQQFSSPVQLQGAQFSFVSNNIREISDFRLSDYIVVGGKNDGLLLTKHLRHRVNKSFAKLRKDPISQDEIVEPINVLAASMIPPFSVWLKE